MVVHKKQCCGCEACAQICPRHCIKMQPDKEGFLYPLTDTQNCINCHLCENVCPTIHKNATREPSKINLVKNPNENIRIQSSSGGAFSIIAEQIIKEHGVVFGAYFDKDWNVIHGYIENIEDLQKFRGSKYVQSHVANTFHDVKKFLIQGRKVLFSGTPCQIAALDKFLNCQEYDNLYKLDFICHGVPSPGIWQAYLNDITLNNKTIDKISFRDKIHGWKNFSMAITFATTDATKGYTKYEPIDKNPYLKGFIANLFLRPSCHNCNFKHFSSKSDITLADAWGMWEYAPEQFDDLGSSLLISFTPKAQTLIKTLFVKNILCDSSIIKKYNPAAYISPKVPKKRTKFFKLISKYDFVTAINKCLPPPTFIDKVLWSINKRIRRHAEK